MKHNIYILFILLGVFILPKTAYACVKESTFFHRVCDDNKPLQTKKDCCAGHKTSHGKENSCDKKCTMFFCHSFSSSLYNADTYQLYQPFALNGISRIFSGEALFISSYFLAFWQPPKIS